MTTHHNSSLISSCSNDCLTGFKGDSEIDLLAQSTSSDLARLLLAYYPGAELKVPKAVDETHHLSRNLGFENARMLSAYAGGGMIDIPTRKFYSGDREIVITEMIEGGYTRQEIAIELGISVRMLRKITQKMGVSGQRARKKEEVASLDTLPASSNASLTLPHGSSNVIPLHSNENASSGKSNHSSKT